MAKRVSVFMGKKKKMHLKKYIPLKLYVSLCSILVSIYHMGSCGEFCWKWSL